LESSSFEEGDSGSDFEEPSPTRKAKAATPKKPRQSRAIDRIPIIKPRKSGGAAKALKVPKAPKTASKGKKVPKVFARVTNRRVEDLDDDEGQSELYGEWDGCWQMVHSLKVLYQDALTHDFIRCCVRFTGGS
jgi:hypothetical protein